jgi:hypothetical protein
MFLKVSFWMGLALLCDFEYTLYIPAAGLSGRPTTGKRATTCSRASMSQTVMRALS